MVIRISPTNSFLEDPPHRFLAYNTHFPWQCRPVVLLDPISYCHGLFLRRTRAACPAAFLPSWQAAPLPSPPATRWDCRSAGRQMRSHPLYIQQAPRFAKQTQLSWPSLLPSLQDALWHSSPRVLTNGGRGEQWELCSGSLLDGVEETLEILTPELRLCCALEPLGWNTTSWTNGSWCN